MVSFKFYGKGPAVLFYYLDLEQHKCPMLILEVLYHY